ncbi:DUF6212 domain-containing protein [Methylobacterium sp. WSM2598]|uniref:DUF6212 domain-containing protein n=1 Tax=Methylobacterium sp. WSM2598 TaxID=398261 RepID=UPI000382DEA7|nr:DUF6212 domain-containing protein [Methylobacterium sp. WSM2598]
MPSDRQAGLVVPDPGDAAPAATWPPRHAFVVLDRLRQHLPAAAAAAHCVALSEKQIDALRGFEISDAAGRPDDALLARPILGAILDRDFIERFPKAVARLRQIAPQVPGADAVFDLSAAGPDGVAAWQLDRALGLSERFLADLGAGQLEIGRLQQIVTEHVEALHAAQRIVDQAVPPQPRLGLFLPPGDAVLCPAELPQVTGLSQNSKREFRAVHAFELHLAAADRQTRASVAIRLRAAHSRDLLGTWTVAAATLDPGWNRFDCPVTARPLDEPVEVELLWERGTAPRLALSLGEETADPRLRAVTSDGAVGQRPLALRIYAGVPGLRLPSRGWGRPADGEAAPEAPSHVRIDELLERAAFGGGLPEPRPELLRYMGVGSGLFLHPADEAPHVAVIRHVRIEGVRAVLADVALAHDEADPTEFGLFAAPSGLPVGPRPAPRGAAPRRWLRHGSPRPGDVLAAREGFDGRAAWLRLRARETGQVLFEAPGPLGDCFDIYLGTRRAGAGTRHALAHFLHLAVVRGTRRA